MCLNPKFLLGYKTIYKGYEKTILFFGTTYDEYCRGYVSLSDIASSNRLTYRLGNQLSKYGITSFDSFCDGSIIIKKPIIFNIRFEIPCRTCLSCTLNRSKEWSLRCYLESLNYKHNYFVTLTYNNKSIPRNFFHVYDSDSQTVLKKSTYTLYKPHTIQFMKSLRQLFNRDYSHQGIRFFMCGEYGSKTGRPHYHFILFNLPLSDLSPIGKSHSGVDMFRSATLERVWKYGFVTVQPFTIETARYTAQYCCKKLNKKSASECHKEMEFINMSRSPGIGALSFFKNVNNMYTSRDDFNFDDSYSIVSVKKGSKTCERFSVPSAFLRYFKPITDSKRNIDTEHGVLRSLLNNDNESIYDIIQLRNFEKSLYCENILKCKMNSLGFNYDIDRFSDKYLDYLSIVKNNFIKKFPVIRNLS